jgi:outer membrane protein insertion porin family
MFLKGSITAVLIMSGGLAWGQAAGGVKFSAIDIRGNSRLSDEEVKDLCGLDASRTYQEADLRAALQCLGSSSEYKNVSFDTEGRSLIVNVQEAPKYTGLLDLSVTADTDRGLSGRLYIEDRNLFDRGLRGFGELEISREERTLALGLSDPDLFDTGYEGGIALSYGQYAYDDAAYKFDRLTLAPFITMPLSETQALTFRAGVQWDDVYDIDPATSPILLSEGGERTSPFVSLQYAGQFETNAGLPTRIAVNASQTFLGLGEDHLSSITKARIKMINTVVPNRLSFALELEGGHLESLEGDPSRVVDRFFLGGGSFRGFSARGIGPVDGGQFLGGNSYAVIRAETNSPIATIAGADVSAGAFADIGAVFGLDNTAGFANPVDDDANLRASVGLSVTVQIGDVPLNIYYANPIKEEAQDKTQSIGVALSTRF